MRKYKIIYLSCFKVSYCSEVPFTRDKMSFIPVILTLALKRCYLSLFAMLTNLTYNANWLEIRTHLSRLSLNIPIRKQGVLHNESKVGLKK